MEPGVRYDWDDHDRGHVAAHQVQPSEVDEVLANNPIYIETRVDARSGEERVLNQGHTKWRPHSVRGMDASRQTQTPRNSLRREPQDPRRIPEETQ